MTPCDDVSRETSDALTRLEVLIRDEAERQNLIARSTFDELRFRHITDAIQLTAWIPSRAMRLLDIGSGAGFPGLVLAIVTPLQVTLVEPRRLRAEFLLRCIAELGLPNATVENRRVEAVRGGRPDAITARAVASLDRLFGMAAHLSGPDTVWILPKGRSAADELATARRSWHGEFEIEPSMTDPGAGIVIARNVARKSR